MATVARKSKKGWGGTETQSCVQGSCSPPASVRLKAISLWGPRSQVRDLQMSLLSFMPVIWVSYLPGDDMPKKHIFCNRNVCLRKAGADGHWEIVNIQV